jgi:hypothetical protein
MSLRSLRVPFPVLHAIPGTTCVRATDGSRPVTRSLWRRSSGRLSAYAYCPAGTTQACSGLHPAVHPFLPRNSVMDLFLNQKAFYEATKWVSLAFREFWV